MAGIPKELREYRRNMIAMRYESEGSVPIARDLGITRDGVLAMAKRMGLVYRDRYKHHGDKVRAASKRPGNGYRKRAENNVSCNIHYFDKWTPNMAYVLGYLFADGCVGKSGLSVRLWLSDKDMEVLKFVKHELKSVLPIHHVPAKGSTGPSSYIDLCSIVLIERLAELGLYHRKTFADYPYPQIPDQCQPHFIRGVFDGDGSTSAEGGGCYVKFIGPVRFINGLIAALVRCAGLMVKTPQIDHGVEATWATVTWTHQDDLRAFYNYIYPQDALVFCLERKKKVLTKWLAVPRNRNRIPPKYRRTEHKPEED